VNDMHAGPPPGGDPLGTIVVMIGALATLYAFVVAVRTTLRPGEEGATHPKRLIFKDGR
jgi:hypothetical protein